MKPAIMQLAIFYIISLAFCVTTEHIFAAESYEFNTTIHKAAFRFNNENWFTEEHPKVASFTIHDDGSSSGLT